MLSLCCDAQQLYATEAVLDASLRNCSCREKTRDRTPAHAPDKKAIVEAWPLKQDAIQLSGDHAITQEASIANSTERRHKYLDGRRRKIRKGRHKRARKIQRHCMKEKSNGETEKSPNSQQYEEKQQDITNQGGKSTENGAVPGYQLSCILPPSFISGRKRVTLDSSRVAVVAVVRTETILRVD